MPTTRSIAESLASAAGHFPFLGYVTPENLVELVRLELGHEEILDGFAPYGGHRARAFGPGTILHIVSGNTPAAALQSVIRGLLLHSRNLVKIPRAGLPEVEAFRDKLPQELLEKIFIQPELPEDWIAQADAVIVFGADETISAIRKKVPAGKTFLAYGHRVSFGIVFDDPECVSARGAARDASLFDQQGCLSPHVFYVRGNAKRYAERLAEEMEVFQKTEPRGTISTEESAQIFHIRTSYRFRASNDSRVAIWESAEADAWTVVCEEDPWFVASCLNRVVYVKPLPENMEEHLVPVAHFIGAIGIWPNEQWHAESLAHLQASRICAIGSMQSPSPLWHQESRQSLAPLVRWVDWEH